MWFTNVRDQAWSWSLKKKEPRFWLWWYFDLERGLTKVTESAKIVKIYKCGAGFMGLWVRRDRCEEGVWLI